MQPATSPHRRRVLWAALAATLAASVWAIMTPVDEAAVAVDPSMPRQRSSTNAPVRVASLQNPDRAALPTEQGSGAEFAVLPRQLRTDAAADPFGPRSWAPTAPAEAPRVVAPPLPFVLAGRMEIDGQVSYLLMEGPRTHIAPVGSHLGAFTLAEAGDEQLVFVHEPTGIKVPLRFAR